MVNRIVYENDNHTIVPNRRPFRHEELWLPLRFIFFPDSSERV